MNDPAVTVPLPTCELIRTTVVGRGIVKLRSSTGSSRLDGHLGPDSKLIVSARLRRVHATIHRKIASSLK
jgi:hypothetical protein